MESRLRIFLLIFSLLSMGPLLADDKAAQGEDGQPLKDIIQQDPVIQPEITRREIKEADIDTENFELGVFAGFLSIEDFGTDTVYGVRLDYHITEDFFLEGVIGMSKAGTTSFERIGANTPILTDDERDYTYYYIAIGYNLFPGEAYITKNTTYNTALYLIAGAGNTEFAGDDRFTITWGGGYRVVVTDWLAFHLDFRDHVFNIDVTGEDKSAHNLESTLGVTFFF